MGGLGNLWHCLRWIPKWRYLCGVADSGADSGQCCGHRCLIWVVAIVKEGSWDRAAIVLQTRKADHDHQHQYHDDCHQQDLHYYPHDQHVDKIISVRYEAEPL